MSEPDSPPSSTRASSLRALVARLRPQPGWADRATHGLLLVVVSVAAAFVIYPGLYEQQIPEIRSQDVGQPFRASSPAGFKAARDYEIINHAMTELRRQQARAAVRPVYDFNPFLLVELRQAIRDSFATMRGILAEQEAAAERAAHPDEPPEKVPARRKKGPVVVEPPDFQKRLQEGRRELEQKLFGRSDLPLEDEDFQELLAAKFSPEVEQVVLSLLERAYSVPVAGSREELSREGTDGLSVRDLRDLREQPRVASAPSVLDVREVQGELDRFASLPGNLLPDRPAALRRAVLRLVRRQIRPNLTINTAETGARRLRVAEEVKDAVIQIKKGQKVIGDGDLINETHLVIISGMRAQTHELDLTQLRLGGTGLVALLLAACFAFHRAAFRRFRPTRKDALLLGGLLVTMLGLLRLSVSIADAVRDRYEAVPATALYYCIPVAAGAMLVRFILTEEMTLFFAIVSSCLAGVLLGNSLAFGIYTLVGSLVAADRISKAKDRVGIFRAGLITGVANLLTVLFVALVEAKGLTGQTLISALFAFVGTSLFVPTLVMAITPLVEAGFGYASDIKLLELANLNHPALKELIVQAPGTYHHSIILGTLVENAAEAIGANPLLARSCAYYHDIGKGRNPLYFGENQKGENRHDALAPAMSALIVKRHVSEGMEMARHYRLPRRVADAIPQHHGTRLVGYFFHKALKEQEGKENPPPMDESTYRYPGPKPQFREAALVMIADAVEASTRSMSEPSSPKLQAQVQKIINLIFAEGQLDECDLTLKDLTLIAQSFLHTLEGIYHARPVYPPGAVGGGRQVPAGTEPIRASTLQVAESAPEEAVSSDVRRGAGG